MEPVEKPDTAPPSRRTGDVTAFLATDRTMGTLSALREALNAPQARELWDTEAFTRIIAGEWAALKDLMERAGF